jgi:hypothetical protein
MRPINPCCHEAVNTMQFRGYNDESFGPDQNLFALSCLIAKSSDWLEMERKWKLHLASETSD